MEMNWKIGLMMVLGAGILFFSCEKKSEPRSEGPGTIVELQEISHDYSGTLTIWGWDDPYHNTMTRAFNRLYPNVKFEYTPVANGDLLQKYQTALATGTELPDIAWAIIDSRAKVFELDMWEPLNKAPYNFNINDTFDYLHPVMVNSSGDVCGIEQSISPAGLAYRRDLAKQYFGTDDPAELEAMFSTWNEFIAKGIEVQQKSGGTIFMWPGIGDAQQFIREQGGKSWITGNTINVTESLLRSIQLACAFRDSNIVDKLEAWSPAWYAAHGEGKHIFVGCATWTIPFVIELNDPEGANSGHWGLMNVPEGNISWGGTTLGISKTCKDKSLAWTFVEFCTLSTEGAEALNSMGLFTSSKKPYTEKPEIKSYKSPWFGDQDIGAKYIGEIVPNIQIRPMNLDDNEVHVALNLITGNLNNDRSITPATAIIQLREELAMNLPDYKIN
jgi:multiple sugar transport system substrate-binding protein